MTCTIYKSGASGNKTNESRTITVNYNIEDSDWQNGTIGNFLRLKVSVPTNCYYSLNIAFPPNMFSGHSLASSVVQWYPTAVASKSSINMNNLTASGILIIDSYYDNSTNYNSVDITLNHHA